MKINFQKELDKTLLELTKEEGKKKLLIHSCCAPCSSYVLEYLQDYFDITVYFYNPNIFPEEEFYRRAEEQKRLIKEKFLDNIGFIEEYYDPQEFYDISRGLEKEPERGARCGKCFSLRLRKAAEYAKSHNFDFFTTTLSVSPYKDASLLNEIGSELSEEYEIKFLHSDFKKKEGYKRSIELSEEYGLYRQDYCGCVYSKAERENLKNN